MSSSCSGKVFLANEKLQFIYLVVKELSPEFCRLVTSKLLHTFNSPPPPPHTHTHTHIRKKNMIDEVNVQSIDTMIHKPRILKMLGVARR